MKLLVFSIIFLGFTIILCLFRAVKGPGFADRLTTINVIGTKTIVLILIVSFILKENYFVDVAMVYALISFVATVVIGKYMESAWRKRI